ncbi:DUF5602 domain-containing protein [Rhodococcus chondri]|uniref:DUF5602 domain-containing protein n=1 Tax=Rhodococcus chondri TaxID=3065941 RepID=A0ABU7JYZ1_9NOCA|nr:DUF5602 domain-containing protein [Rhodococcus sp. CC-R104]MEE2035235.1 DUF5602 domain-containing protein [Rhodococcus sp. CC-R104]
MRDHRSARAVALLLAACLSVAACSAATAAPPERRTVFGSTGSLGEGTVRTYTTVDRDGNPIAVGLRMSSAALDGLPHSDVTSVLDLPGEASATVFDHVMLNWNPHGHGPSTLFDRPHVDVHFYMTDTAAVEAIDPASPDFWARATHLPEAKYIPSDYVTPPGPLAVLMAAPFMGVHWMDATAGMIPGVYDFTQTFLNGTWDGDYTFMEPMFTRAWLLTEPTLREHVKQPQAYQHTAWYPTVYAVRFDYATQEFDIALEGMVFRQQS